MAALKLFLCSNSNYSFVHIQNSLTNLIGDQKFFTIFCLKNGVSEANLNTNKIII